MQRDRDLFVIIAATRWDGPAYTERHVAEALTEHGDVLWAEPPLSIFGARRRSDLTDGRTRPGLVAAGPHVLRVIPPTPPGKDRPGIRALAGRLHAGAVQWALRRDGRRPRAVLGFAARLHAFPGARDLATARIAWIKDDLVAGAELTGLDHDRLVAGRDDLLRRADLVVAASPTIADDLAARGVPSVVIPGGADVERFATATELAVPADVPTARGRAAGFVGQLGSRVDVRLLQAVADAGIPLLMVGPMASPADAERFRALLAHPEVTWTGPRPYEDLPGYLGAMGVGTVPYAQSPFNRASFPLKLIEYLSAGLSVVSTDLPAARWLATEHVRIAEEPHIFAEQVRAALDSRSPATAAAARDLAATHSWSERVGTLLAQLEAVWSPTDC